MQKIILQESTLKLANGGFGKIGVLIYFGDDDLLWKLDEAVSIYVDSKIYNQYVDINMDNPYVRIIVEGISDMVQTVFDPQKDRL